MSLAPPTQFVIVWKTVGPDGDQGLHSLKDVAVTCWPSYGITTVRSQAGRDNGSALLFKGEADLQRHLISAHLPILNAASDLPHLKPTKAPQASRRPRDCVFDGFGDALL